jgi:predicted SAM-dependent methyltransferase
MIKLNLGSGQALLEDFINIDNREEMNPDVCCDVTEGLPYEDNSVDYVRAFDFLEHIAPNEVISVMEEIWRVLKHDGIFESHTPDAEYGQTAFQDPTHISFWVENSWLYYSNASFRSLYSTKANFKIESLTRIPPFSQEGRAYWIHVVAIAVKEEETKEDGS